MSTRIVLAAYCLNAGLALGNVNVGYRQPSYAQATPGHGCAAVSYGSDIGYGAPRGYGYGHGESAGWDIHPADSPWVRLPGRNSPGGNGRRGPTPTNGKIGDYGSGVGYGSGVSYDTGVGYGHNERYSGPHYGRRLSSYGSAVGPGTASHGPDFGIRHAQYSAGIRHGADGYGKTGCIKVDGYDLGYGVVSNDRFIDHGKNDGYGYGHSGGYNQNIGHGETVYGRDGYGVNNNYGYGKNVDYGETDGYRGQHGFGVNKSHRRLSGGGKKSGSRGSHSRVGSGKIGSKVGHKTPKSGNLKFGKKR